MFDTKLAADRLDVGWTIVGAPNVLGAGGDLQLEVLRSHLRDAGLIRSVDQRQLENRALSGGQALFACEGCAQFIG